MKIELKVDSIQRIKGEDVVTAVFNVYSTKHVDDEVSTYTLEVIYDSNALIPNCAFGKYCLDLLYKYDEYSILKEKSNIREAFYIGRLIDRVSQDILLVTKFSTSYKFSETENNKDYWEI